MPLIDSKLLKYIKTVKKTHYHDILRYDRKTKKKYWEYPAAVSICYAPDGRSARGCSQSPIGISWDSTLLSNMRRIGKIGEHTSLCHNILGKCAEQHSANHLAKKIPIRIIGIDQLLFSITVRPRTMQPLNPCENCVAIFPSLTL